MLKKAEGGGVGRKWKGGGGQKENDLVKHLSFSGGEVSLASDGWMDVVRKALLLPEAARTATHKH